MRLVKNLCAFAVAIVIVIAVCLTGFHGDYPELGLSIELIFLGILGFLGSVIATVYHFVWRKNNPAVSIFFLTLLLAAVLASIYLDKIVVYLYGDLLYK